MDVRGQMVEFPGVGPSMEDRGENGMFVIMIVPQPEDFPTSCCVDVWASLNRPDVCVSPIRDFWEPYEYSNARSVAYDRLKKAGMDDLAEWAQNTQDVDDSSVPLLASVYLGSTALTLWDTSKGDYWQATPDDLTVHGRLMLDLLKGCYHTDPVLLTFLDT